ncbi:hypothetical protein HDU89_002745 [Geranomyces variabilis]|nr:hypothetical protein HDU89_002745 [Geranomyces variabilis]
MAGWRVRDLSDDDSDVSDPPTADSTAASGGIRLSVSVIPSAVTFFPTQSATTIASPLSTGMPAKSSIGPRTFGSSSTRSLTPTSAPTAAPSTLAAESAQSANLMASTQGLGGWLTIGLPLILGCILVALIVLCVLVWRVWRRGRRHGVSFTPNAAEQGMKSTLPAVSHHQPRQSMTSSAASTAKPIPPRRHSSIPPSPPSPYFFEPELLHEPPVPELTKHPALKRLHSDEATITRGMLAVGSSSGHSSTSPPVLPLLDLGGGADPSYTFPPPAHLSTSSLQSTYSPPPRPPPFIDLSKPHTAKYTHTPRRPDEIAIKPGDTLTVRTIYKDGWCVGLNVTRQTQGFFPAATVKVTDWIRNPAPLPDPSDTRTHSDLDDDSAVASSSQPPSQANSNTSSEGGTLVGPPKDMVKALEELDWALEAGVIDVGHYLGQRKRVFLQDADS